MGGGGYGWVWDLAYFFKRWVMTQDRAVLEIY